MARMTAELVVSLLDRASGRAQTIKRNLTALQRAERDVYLARNNMRLTRAQVAEERLLDAQEAERQKRLAQWTTAGRVAGVAVAAAGYVAIRTARDYAQLERTIGRIIINADKPATAIRPTIAVLQELADKSKLPFDNVVQGLETLIASGRSLEEALAFLPTVARTAQASGAEMSDIALTADALANSLGITADKMQEAFDILAFEGKAGKFELKDMAAELPAIAPAFAALGYKGTEGLKRLAAMLEIVRNQTGSSAEAATNFSNILQKAYGNEVANNFKKYNIDIRRELDRTRKEGGDVIETLVEQTNKALKGDLSKLPLIFTDIQMQQGMRALLTQMPELKKHLDALGSASGTVARDFAQITGDSEGNWQQLINNIQKTATALGDLSGRALNPTLEKVNDRLSDMMAVDKGYEALRGSGRDPLSYAAEFKDRFNKQHPELGMFDRFTGASAEKAFRDALAQLGRGEIKNIFDALQTKILEDRKTREPNTGMSAATVPMPTPRPKSWAEMTPAERQYQVYAQGRHAPAKGGQAYVPPSPGNAGIGPNVAGFDADEFERRLQSGGADAGSKIAEGGTQAGQNAAQTFTSGVAGAGSSFGKSAAAAFIAGVSGFLSSAKADLMRPVGSLGGRTTGQQVQSDTRGQAIDFGGPR
ncbi:MULTISPECIES: phage tail tape measure protein [unclassified Mesorhizobium]|uniref:phage tail tape measure protein n=1 Tax=unclassified Mesorhizobium TaxID=325217 RepID=UPI000F761417|nr:MULTISPECIES: phage tail tape measure protein [unclassified Mesorhizobium]AZO38748.1 phage tail tape measure protein [Mesorhizobium sp. M2A.F.Ca.ET.046.03.2.1]RVC71630.1 phage tail tape measure protein [Mesorhizobium sp. M2A.F.Ca.ET.046.02.1.1]RWB43619.1 MAG: phage tail tape measure protein [Mesorhizobium sp.]RWF32917.1 MAG: phage tail tape measure protein [Mesorhizobium sp.]